MICWLIGHRYDYEFGRREGDLLALVCTRCGRMHVLYEMKAAKLKPISPYGIGAECQSSSKQS